MPNSIASPAAPDFVTALGRLLQSGPLRDAFTADRQALAHEMKLSAEDRAAFFQLVPDELEAQAVVLLRKRFDLVRCALPLTSAALGEQAWPEFRSYARVKWPTDTRAVVQDALGFCVHLREVRADAICPREWHRLKFLHGGARLAIRYVHAARSANRERGGVQILFRWRAARWHEWWLYLGV